MPVDGCLLAALFSFANLAVPIRLNPAFAMKTKLRAAGGIRTSKRALPRLNPQMFRFGASTLVKDVLMQIAQQVDGNYQGSDYFSLP